MSGAEEIPLFKPSVVAALMRQNLTHPLAGAKSLPQTGETRRPLLTSGDAAQLFADRPGDLSGARYRQL